MKLILFFIFILLFLFCVVFRCAVLNPHFSLWYTVKDLFYYFRHKRWREAKCGELVCYVGLFGRGKTLSAVHTIVRRYKSKHNKIVFDIYRRKWVKQNVVILSNVELNGVPYIHFSNLNQIVNLTHELDASDKVNNTLTYLYVLGDEFSVQLNSRNFKNNLNAQVLNSILTCRHYHMSMFYTAQRFNHVDALLRQVTQTVVSCGKVWRFQRQDFYDAYELENCTNPLNVKPKHRGCWFVRNKDFAYYDTLACVDNLSKSALDGDMISDLEILNLQAPGDGDTTVHYSRRGWKNKR